MEIHGRKRVLDMKMAEFRKLADYDGEKAKGYLVDQNNGGFTYLILKTADNKVVGIRVMGDRRGSTRWSVFIKEN